MPTSPQLDPERRGGRDLPGGHGYQARCRCRKGVYSHGRDHSRETVATTWRSPIGGDRGHGAGPRFPEVIAHIPLLDRDSNDHDGRARALVVGLRCAPTGSPHGPVGGRYSRSRGAASSWDLFYRQ